MLRLVAQKRTIAPAGGGGGLLNRFSSARKFVIGGPTSASAARQAANGAGGVFRASPSRFALFQASTPKRIVPQVCRDFYAYGNKYIGPRGWVGLYPLGLVIFMMSSGHYFVVIREQDRQFLGTNMVNVWVDTENSGLNWRHPYVRGSCYEVFPDWKGKDQWRGSQQSEHGHHDDHHH
ncbi:unnamed protein product [Amoebophrya sp. A120]|nr:unnamed protein product [Amoebophrya sp. A120]|eukprot:GSA120T00006617001.1